MGGGKTRSLKAGKRVLRLSGTYSQKLFASQEKKTPRQKKRLAAVCRARRHIGTYSGTAHAKGLDPAGGLPFIIAIRRSMRAPERLQCHGRKSLAWLLKKENHQMKRVRLSSEIPSRRIASLSLKAREKGRRKPNRTAHKKSCARKT